MIRRIDLRGTHVDARTTLPRAAMDVADASTVIAPILEDVRTQGAPAVGNPSCTVGARGSAPS